jgi:hypothetical protein
MVDMYKYTCMILLFLAFVVMSADEWHTSDVEDISASYCSIAVDSESHPHISYHWDYYYLKYAYWDGIWHTEVVDDYYPCGYYSSIAVDAENHPHISHIECWDNDGVRYARWNGSEWELHTLVWGGGYEYTSIALDSKGYPHVACSSYFSSPSLRYYYFDGSQWNNELFDMGDNEVSDVSIAIDSNDYPHIVYSLTGYRSGLRYLFFDGDEWIEDSIGAGEYGSIAIDSLDRPWVSYKSSGLYCAHREDGGWETEYIDWGGDYSSIALDSNDYPHICCSGGNLAYYKWNGTEWDSATVDTGNFQYSSLDLDSQDKPHICYSDVTNHVLIYAYFGPQLALDYLTNLSASVVERDVLINWAYNRDVPVSADVLRSRGGEEPEYINDNPLPGASTRYLDRGVEPGGNYVYWLEVTEADGTVSRFGPTEAVSVPAEAFTLVLDAAYPSPSREAVNFSYSIPEDGRVVLAVYDLSGRRVATPVDADETAGRHEVAWNCGDIPSGVYLYRLETSAGALTRRLVVSR